MIIEAFEDETVFDFGRSWVVPEIFKFVGIGFEVKELAEAFAMVGDKLVFLGAIHRREGLVSITEFFGEGVEVFGADAIAVVIGRSIATEDGAQA